MIRIGAGLAVVFALGGLIWMVNPSENKHLLSTLPSLDTPSLIETQVEEVQPQQQVVAAPEKTTWEYRADPHQGDQLVSQITLSKAGAKFHFSSSLVSGRMTAPDAEGTRTEQNDKKHTYSFRDSFGNEGKLIITMDDEDKDIIVVSFEVTKIEEPRAMMHYETNRYTRLD